MHRRLTARVLLVCYGVIALAGQGLHEFLDDDGCCDQAEQSASAVVAVQDGGQTQEAGQPLVVQSPGGGHVHDCDNCPICQFQALGQYFVAPPPALTVFAVCEILSPNRVEAVHCPALFSPARPRAPPVA